MSLRDLANNLRTEDEFHTFVKRERVIRRTLSLQHTHQEMSEIIRSHSHEEERKSNVKACMTNYFLHRQHTIVNDVCFTFDCWGAIYRKNDFTLPHTHGPALWSWVYYISIPNNAPPLYFDEAKFKVYPKSDEIILFPGHVRHEVPKAENMTEERIVLAGNIYLDYRNT